MRCGPYCLQNCWHNIFCHSIVDWSALLFYSFTLQFNPCRRYYNLGSSWAAQGRKLMDAKLMQWIFHLQSVFPDGWVTHYEERLRRLRLRLFYVSCEWNLWMFTTIEQPRLAEHRGSMRLPLSRSTAALFQRYRPQWSTALLRATENASRHFRSFHRLLRVSFYWCYRYACHTVSLRRYHTSHEYYKGES